MRTARDAAHLVAGLWAVLLLAAAGPPADEKPPPREKVVIAGETFKLELAVDEKTRSRGLGGRDRIEDHGGMLFVFPDVRWRAFWMKDCLIDIDLIFLDDRGRIDRLHKMSRVPPRRDDEPLVAYERRLRLYPSTRPIRFAIELEAGSIERLELKPGTVIELDLPRLRKLAR